MDPLLPVGETGRKKVPDTDYDVTQKYRSELHKPHVCGTSNLSRTQCPVSWVIVLSPYHASLIIIHIFFRNATKNGIESPVWPCGRPVSQHLTLRFRTGITNLRNSSLNLAPMKPVYVFTPFSFINDAVFTELQHWVFLLLYYLLVPGFNAY